MDNLSIEGWYKAAEAHTPTPLDEIRFYISPACHLELEAAEEELLETHAPEKFVEVDIDALQLEMPSDIGPLTDCRLRVYRGGPDNRGQFHLVGHSARDNGLIYTNAVMIDQLG